MIDLEGIVNETEIYFIRHYINVTKMGNADFGEKKN